MRRRTFFSAMLSLALLSTAHALDLSDLTNKDASTGLRTALSQGAEKAVGQLGVTDGFFGNNQVRIGLPESLSKAEGMMRRFGMGKMADELTLTMNRAAESAVVEAKPLLLDAIKKMTLADAKSILSGPDDAATQYFKKTSGEALTAAIESCPDLIKPNKSEAEKAAQASIFGEDDALKAIKILRDRGSRAVCLTLGADGLVYGSVDAEPIFVTPPKVDVISTVGCGDATVAGFAVAMKRRLDPAASLQLAAACGAANCLAHLPGQIEKKIVDDLIDNVVIRSGR